MVAQKAAIATESKSESLRIFSVWTAATYMRDGQLTCYALARPASSAASARKSKTPVLLVAIHGKSSPTVVITSGAYPNSASAKVALGAHGFPFFSSKGNAYARRSEGMLPALRNGASTVATPAPPHQPDRVATFSLQGFTAAYNAAAKACSS
jgi:hypothetical protein